MFKCGPIKNLVLLGASSIFEKFCELSSQNNVASLIVTSPDQLGKLSANLENVVSVADIKSEEAEKQIKERLQPGETLAISFGARWILKEAERNKLFGGKVLNAHGTRLPSDRGGGGFTWRVMRGDRIGNLVLHEVDDGVDTGSIVRSEEYIIPVEAQTPAQCHQDYISRLGEFVCQFLQEVFTAERSYTRNHQLNYNSTYYPRIHTETHGWIDWSWSAHDIEKFILAFDNPFPGARCMYKNGVAILKKCQLHVGEIGHHPFQKGIVIRNNHKWLTIALENEYSLLCEDIKDENGIDLIPGIFAGDRLFSAAPTLDTALSSRVQFTSKGLKPQN
jgi:methionyl-tRNA formyltransferase